MEGSQERPRFADSERRAAAEKRKLLNFCIWGRIRSPPTKRKRCAEATKEAAAAGDEEQDQEPC